MRMHEHINDEILSWLWQGTMVHEDRTGQRVALSAERLMLMNAGASFWHEESVRGPTVEMLQIFVRPRESSMTPRVQFWDAPRSHGWRHVAGPENSGAPLEFRQSVTVFDCNAGAGQQIDAPVIDGMASWLYLMDGRIRVGDQTMATGDAVAVAEGDRLPVMISEAPSTLVLFLVDRNAPASRAGTISGR